jgi:hypothetical protein
MYPWLRSEPVAAQHILGTVDLSNMQQATKCAVIAKFCPLILSEIISVSWATRGQKINWKISIFKRLATGWTVRRSNPGAGGGGGGARFPASIQTAPGAHPAACAMGTGSLPGVKLPGRDAGRPRPSSAVVKERAKLYHYSPLVSSWTVLGWTLALKASGTCNWYRGFKGW